MNKAVLYDSDLAKHPDNVPLHLIDGPENGHDTLQLMSVIQPPMTWLVPMDALCCLVSYNTNIFNLSYKQSPLQPVMSAEIGLLGLKDQSQNFMNRFRIIQMKIDVNWKIYFFKHRPTYMNSKSIEDSDDTLVCCWYSVKLRCGTVTEAHRYE